MTCKSDRLKNNFENKEMNKTKGKKVASFYRELQQL